jgi:hypothetical protein
MWEGVQTATAKRNVAITAAASSLLATLASKSCELPERRSSVWGIMCDTRKALCACASAAQDTAISGVGSDFNGVTFSKLESLLPGLKEAIANVETCPGSVAASSGGSSAKHRLMAGLCMPVEGIGPAKCQADGGTGPHVWCGQSTQMEHTSRLHRGVSSQEVIQRLTQDGRCHGVCPRTLQGRLASAGSCSAWFKYGPEKSREV